MLYNCNFSFYSQGNIGSMNECITCLRAMCRTTKWEWKQNADSDLEGGLLPEYLCIPVNNMPLLCIDLLYGNSTASDRSAELVETVCSSYAPEQTREARSVMVVWVSKDWVLSGCPWLRGSCNGGSPVVMIATYVQVARLQFRKAKQCNFICIVHFNNKAIQSALHKT